MEEFDEYGFPAEYPSDILNEMHSRLHISEEEFQHLHQLFDAANNLYARISLKKLYELYCHFFPEISQEDFLDAVEIIAHERGNYYSIIGREVFYKELQPGEAMDRELVAEYLYVCEDESYKALEQAQAGKPWYIPEWEEFVKYTDEFYIQDTAQYRLMLQYLKNTQKSLRCPPEEVMEDMHLGLRLDGNIQNAVNSVQHLGITFQNEQEFQQFLTLLLKESQHTRRYEHRGHTPAELGLPGMTMEEALHEMTFDLNYSDQLDKFMDLADTYLCQSTITGKPARNAPCPCGSGKKYKNCCGK